MKYLKLYEEYNSHQDIINFCEDYGLRHYTVNDNGLIDVDNDVDLYFDVYYDDVDNPPMEKIPFPFGRVDGYFNIDEHNLKNLINSPLYVSDIFSCDGNNLTSLEGISKKIGNGLSCGRNADLYWIKGTEDEEFSLGGQFVCQNTPFSEIYNLVGKKWYLSTIQEFHFQDLIIEHKNNEYICNLYYLNNFLTIMSQINQTKFDEEDYITSLKNYKCI